MWSRARPRALLLATSHHAQLSKTRHRQLIPKTRRLSSRPPLRPSAGAFKSNRGGGTWQQTGGGGGGGWNHNDNSRRWLWNLNQAVPLPWLAVACFSTADLAYSAYVTETEDFSRLIQRCSFHVDAATADGDTSGLPALVELLGWVCDSIDAVGPTTLPKLLDADVIGIALRGAGSPNIYMSSLCHEILSVLSHNEHVAARMATDPSLRAALVWEVKRQVHGWKFFHGGDDEAAPPHHAGGQSPEPSPEEGGGANSPPPPVRHASRPWRERAHVGDAGADAPGPSDEGEEVLRPPVKEIDEGGSWGEDGAGGYPGQATGGPDVGAEASDDDVVTVSVDPTYAAQSLRTLGNVMRASRRKARERNIGSHESGVGDGWGRTGTIPWPLRLLYGGNRYGEIEGDGAAGEASEWPFEEELVGHLAELLLSVSVRGAERIPLLYREGDQGAAQVEQRRANQALLNMEEATAAVLRETSCNPHLVGLLMRRRPIVALATVSWKGHSVKAEDLASEAALNVCAAYRRLHGLSEDTKPARDYEPLDSALTTWWDENLAAESASTAPADLDAREEDHEFVLQAEETISPLALPSPLLTITASSVIGLVSAPWGVARRWVAWRRAGEAFSAVSRLSLPRALLWAGFRAGLGATVLTATHGSFGFQSQVRYKTLDATRGRRGTLAMCGFRDMAELGYLFALIRLCPYALLPAIVLNTMLSETTDVGVEDFVL